ncbi:MAG: dihydroorotase [Bacteroidota bacterium]
MSILILNAKIVNEGITSEGDILVKNGFIEKIGKLSHLNAEKIIDAKGNYLIPGVIDDQVHFREPGLTHKATIGTEAAAAVAGGVTSFMEMPNTIPNALTQKLLQDKYDIASTTSLANYSFYMGCSNDNLKEALQSDPKSICGLKIFMGSSTGNMLVDEPSVLEAYFANSPMLIATHCEDEATIKRNMEVFKEKYGENAPASIHPLIRNVEACTLSTDLAISLAQKHQTRLHILHISTAEEVAKFEIKQNGVDKKITSEACVHHLWFSADDYETLGNQIKCNPAIKADGNRQAILQGLIDNRIDLIATDHAPHTWAEKQNNYWNAPSGLPLVQHSLQMMLEFVAEGKISIEFMVEKMSHSPATIFQIEKRGYIKEGYWADLVLLENKNYTVSNQNIAFKCGWSPLNGHTFKNSISKTIVSGNLVWDDGNWITEKKGQRLQFSR